jgi:Thermopsin
MNGKLVPIVLIAVLATLLLSGLTSQGSASTSAVAPSAAQSSHPIHVTSAASVPSADLSRLSKIASSSTTPRPMGISDDGVGASGSTYSYSTSSFQGTTTINSFTVDKGPSADPTSATIQLNLNLEFLDSGTAYTYWVQDLAQLNTTSHALIFWNNVWNVSSTSGCLSNSALSGNGSVYPYSGCDGYYYYGVWGTSNLSYPGTITLTETTNVTSSGVPQVFFSYNFGHGTVTYDTVKFVFVHHLQSSNGFTVSGTSTTPYGSLYDAELVLGGPGGGSRVTATAANIDMTLEYWNGDNYEAIPNANNYGFDTAETIANITDSAYYYNDNGTLYVQLTAGVTSLSTTLGLVWTSGQLALIQVTTQPFTLSGSLSLNGTTGTGFINGQATIRVGPGVYSLVVLAPDIYDPAGSATVTSGSSTSLSAAYLYVVNFGESTLPSGTNWSMTFGQFTEWSVGGVVITFYVTNGTWAYSVGYVPGYTSNNSGTVHVSGKNRGVTITFEEMFGVTIREKGLPTGTWWNVSIDNGSLGTLGTNSNSVGTFLPNGTYTFTVSHVAGYNANVYSKTVSVAGRSFGLTYYFTQPEYTITFSETGLANGAVWSVTIDGHTHSTNGTSLSVTLANGTYSFKIHAKGYKVKSGPSSPLTVNGAALGESVTFKP